MKNLKKSLALLLSVIMLLSCFTAGMVASATVEGNYYYTVEDGKAIITSVADSSVPGKVVIPSTLGGYPVVAIDDYAFEYCGNITSVVIPDSVKTIGYDAFYACDEIESMDLGNGITDFPFDILDLDKLEEIIIGKNVRITADEAYRFFHLCDSFKTLTKITVSKDNPWLDAVDGVLYGEDMTLLLYYPLSSAATSYTMPATVKGVFYPLYLAKNIQKIEYNDKFSLMNDYEYDYESFEMLNDDGMLNDDTALNVFMALEMLSYIVPVNAAEIVVNASNPYLVAEENVLYNKDKSLLVRYAANRADKSFEIPSSVEWMATEAFSGARNLELTISDGFTNNLNDFIVKIDGSDSDVGVADAVEMFLSSSAAKSFSVADTNKYLKTENGVLYNKGMTDLIKYPIDSYGDYYELPATIGIENLVNPDAMKTGAFASIAGAQLSVYPEYITASNLTVHVSESTFDLFLDVIEDEEEIYEAIAAAFLGVKQICVEDEFFSLKAYNEEIERIVEVVEEAEEMVEKYETMLGLYETLYADLSSETVDNKAAMKKFIDGACEAGIMDEEDKNEMLAELEAMTDQDMEELMVTLPLIIEEFKALIESITQNPDFIIELGFLKAMNVRASLCKGEHLYEIVWRNAPASIKTPSTAEIKHGETLVLHAEYKDIPAGAKFVWTVTGEGVEIEPSEDGSKCRVTSTGKGTATVTLTVVAENGKNVKDENGVDLGSTIEIESVSNFWLKIVSFFKNLFGINRTIEQYTIMM